MKANVIVASDAWGDYDSWTHCVFDGTEEEARAYARKLTSESTAEFNRLKDLENVLYQLEYTEIADEFSTANKKIVDILIVEKWGEEVLAQLQEFPHHEYPFYDVCACDEKSYHVEVVNIVKQEKQNEL